MKKDEDISPTKFFMNRLKQMDLVSEDNSEEGIRKLVNDRLHSINNECLKD